MAMAGGTQERRAHHGAHLARAMLDAGRPVTFGDLTDAAPTVTTRELAEWLGHAIADGLVAEDGPGPEGERRFRLRARGRRILSAQRRVGDALV